MSTNTLMPKLWAVSRKHGYITAGDFIGGRYGSPMLELAVAFTGMIGQPANMEAITAFLEKRDPDFSNL